MTGTKVLALSPYFYAKILYFPQHSQLARRHVKSQEKGLLNNWSLPVSPSSDPFMK